MDQSICAIPRPGDDIRNAQIGAKEQSISDDINPRNVYQCEDLG